MKIGPVTKFDKRDKIESKRIEDDVILGNCHVIANFPNYNQFGAIQKPDFGCIVCKTYIFINGNLLTYKN